MKKNLWKHPLVVNIYKYRVLKVFKIKGSIVSMYYSVPYTVRFKDNTMHQTNQPLEEVLARDDELLYDYLYTKAPTQEEKEIIDTIRTNKIKQNDIYRRIYQDFRSALLIPHSYAGFQEPSSYLVGIKRALFHELADIERHRTIRSGILNQHYRDMVIEVFSNQLMHANMFNYILTKNKSTIAPFKEVENNTNQSNTPSNNKEVKEFTISELAKYNGVNGKPAYVAVDGIVYDVSLEKTWGGASHFGLEAGKDLSAQYNSCHFASQITSKLPKVGTLKANNV